MAGNFMDDVFFCAMLFEQKRLRALMQDVKVDLQMYNKARQGSVKNWPSDRNSECLVQKTIFCSALVKLSHENLKCVPTVPVVIEINHDQTKIVYIFIAILF